ncbi:hypothetical protein V5029_23620, partial [Enterobacter hormaechei]|uniref:hypothetical protein n=1 Tax=Enterobacter hormaechei TaxID=158836 RepID=UPI0030763901
MNILITTTAFTALFCGAAFAQSSDIAHEAHRFVNNASAVSHVNSSTHENLPDRVNKNNTPSFSEMNEHERAIVAHSFMNNSASYAHQKMIEEHKKMLSGSDANSKTSSSSFKEVAIKWSAAPDMTPQTVLYRRPVAQFSNFQPKIVSSWLIL